MLFYITYVKVCVEDSFYTGEEILFLQKRVNSITNFKHIIVYYACFTSRHSDNEMSQKCM